MIQKFNAKCVSFKEFKERELPALGKAVFFTEVSNDRNDWRPIETLDEYNNEKFITVSYLVDIFTVSFMNFQII